MDTRHGTRKRKLQISTETDSEETPKCKLKSDLPLDIPSCSYSSSKSHEDKNRKHKDSSAEFKYHSKNKSHRKKKKDKSKLSVKNKEKKYAPLNSADEDNNKNVFNIHQIKIMEKLALKNKVGKRSQKKHEPSTSPSKKMKATILDNSLTVKKDVSASYKIPKIKKSNSGVTSDIATPEGRIFRTSSNSAEKRLRNLRRRLSDSVADENVEESPNFKPSVPIQKLNSSKRVSFHILNPKMIELGRRIPIVLKTKKKDLSIESVIPQSDETKDNVAVKNVTTDVEIPKDVSERSISSLENSLLKIDDTNQPSKVEVMDWESVVEQIIQVREDSQRSKFSSGIELLNNNISEKCLDKSVKTAYMVVDTNIFISHLSTLEKLTDVSRVECIRIMVPWVVLCELDKLKSYSRESFANTQIVAQKAIRYLHDNLSSNPKICGQSLKLATQHIFPCKSADDEILNCCLQLSDSGEDVILLSNDINLCNKAAVNNIKFFTHKEFDVQFDKCTERKEIVTNVADSSAILSNNSCLSITDSDTQGTNVIEDKTDKTKYNALEYLLHDFLSCFLEDVMKEIYNELWIKIVFVEPPWTLTDLFKCLMKHWIAVLKDILPADAQNTIRDLQNFFPPRKKGKALISETNFEAIKALSIRLLKYFPHISKYSNAANKCIDDIKLLCAKSETKLPNTASARGSIEHTQIEEINFNTGYLQSSSEISSSATRIIEILQIIWDGLCNFCGNLANFLNVSHSLCIKSENSTNHTELVSQASAVGNQIQLLISYMTRMLSSFDSSLAMDQRNQEMSLASVALSNIWQDTICGMGYTSSYNMNSEDVLNFSVSHRNLLEEAHHKFISLNDIIMECSQKYAELQAGKKCEFK